MAATLDQIESSLQVGNAFLERILTAVGKLNEAAKGGGKDEAEDAGNKGGGLGNAMAIVAVVLSLVKFAEALDPSSIEQFNLAIRNVFAVLGQTVLPLFQSLTGILNETGGALDSVMRELGPLFGELGNMLGRVIIPQMQLLASVLSLFAPWIPLLEMLTNVIEVVNLGFVLLSVIIKSVAQFIAGLLGSNLKDVAGQFKSMLEKFVNALLIAIGSLLKFVGLTNTLDNLIAAIKPQQAGVQAAGQTSFRGFEDVAKEVAIKAAMAQGGAGGSNKLDLSEAINELVKIQRGESSKFDAMVTELKELVAFLKGAASATLRAGERIVTNPTGRPSSSGILGAFNNPLGAAVGMFGG